MIYGLNLFACGKGEGLRPKQEPCGTVENLVEVCERFKVWDETLGNLDFGDFFAKRGVTYDGEEVRVAQTLTWEGVRNSLPDEVGQLDLRDFCTQGTLHYLDHFEEHLIDSSDLPCPRAPRVMVGDDWPSICEGLIKKNICEVMPVDDLFHVNQVPLLNGMFGVGKGEFVSEIETQRLIMNLVPLNRLCEPLVGDVCTLPNISSFGTFLLDDGEVALISSEDIRCFFYFSRSPRPGKGFSDLIAQCLRLWNRISGKVVHACSRSCPWDSSTVFQLRSTSIGTSSRGVSKSREALAFQERLRVIIDDLYNYEAP